jgi:hypothetical protein
MTERTNLDLFETRFADRIRAYTDVAVAPQIDALEVSRAAMRAARATGWWQRRSGSTQAGPRITRAGWAASLVAVAIIGFVTIGVLRQPSGIGPQPTPTPSSTAGGPIPDALLHTWERPYEVAPGPEDWGSGSLQITSDLLDVRPYVSGEPSKSTISAAGPDSITVTTTAGSEGCATGDVGTYRWIVEGKGTFLTLTATSGDACAAREDALTGPWVRSDYPRTIPGTALVPGTHSTAAFDPFGDVPQADVLSYTVPEGWSLVEDGPGVLVLGHPADASQNPPTPDSFIFVIAQPRTVAPSREGAACTSPSDAPGVGRGADDLVAALTGRPGVVSTPPVAVRIGDYEARMLDLRIDPSWKGCVAPEGPVVGMTLVYASPMGPLVGIGPDHPARLILVDLDGGRTIAIAVACFGPAQPHQVAEQIARAMPIIESFDFHPPTS